METGLKQTYFKCVLPSTNFVCHINIVLLYTFLDLDQITVSIDKLHNFNFIIQETWFIFYLDS